MGLIFAGTLVATFAGRGTAFDTLVAVKIGSIAFAFAIAGAVAAALAVSFAGTFAIGRAGARGLAGMVAIAGIISGVLSYVGSEDTFLVDLNGNPASVATRIAIAAIAFAGAIVGVAVSVEIARQALAENVKQPGVRRVAITYAAWRATSFQRAKLTDTDLSKAVLQNVDLRQACLTRTCWYGAKQLDLSLAERTYLQDAQVRKLLISGQGNQQTFRRKNLQGANLQGANLIEADFTGANLNEANLQSADLSRATLKQAQLDGANLDRAILTGAYIEDWGITAETRLSRVECEYVYMRVPTSDNPNPRRKPDNYRESFATGDFADFIKPIVDTLDLYHNQGVDPRAIAISLKQLAEKNPDAQLEIVAMEKRGGDNFLLRAKTADAARHSNLSAEYFATYNRFKALPEKHIRLLIAAQSDRIRSLETMVMTALQRPSFYAQTYQNQGGTMSENKSSKIEIGSVGGDLSGFAGGGVVAEDMTGVALGQISGSVTNSIGQLAASEAAGASELAELLKQLQGAIEAEAQLSEEDKSEALEQLDVLAEAGQQPEDSRLKRAAKTAMKILQGTVASLPNATKMVEACAKLLPAIATLLALV